MQLIAFAFGVFVFVGIFLLVLKYTTYLSKLKK
ncbi:cbb3-type cytochrome oxidase subunit 3 [Alicyclobacillus cycloheptanicus]|uniref:Cbb3-type cytochrome oxidase subunit 3 n=1 Tax=Alicyclobacillus cycloheptanicus TaxID=1457 RepID=A0ABT9XJ18_9BACL|nr:cbb3-type cytochrome oxidase subunit 3 [Alicyclobacillus cycloheptanicus]